MNLNKGQSLFVYTFLLVFVAFVFLPLNKALAQGTPVSSSFSECSYLMSNPGTGQVQQACEGQHEGESYQATLGYDLPTTGPQGEQYAYATNGDPNNNYCFSLIPTQCNWQCGPNIGMATKEMTYSWDGSTCYALPNGPIVSTTCGTPQSVSVCLAYYPTPPTDSLCVPATCNLSDVACYVNWECGPVSTQYDFLNRPYQQSQCNPNGPIDPNVCGSVENCSNGIDDDGDGSIDNADSDCGSSVSFVMNVNPSSQSVPLGGAVTYNVSVTPSGAFSQTINLSASSCDGYSCSFNYTSLAYPYDTSSNPLTLTVQTNGSTPPNSDNFVITGTASSYADDVSATVNVTAGTPPPPSNLNYSCNPAGTKATFTWIAPGGYNTFYLRTNLGYNDVSYPADWEKNDAVGTSYEYDTTSGQQFTFYMHTRDPITSAWSSHIWTNAVCTATVVNGSCGTANKVYPSGAPGYGSDTFCTTGTASPSNPGFPAQGASISWSCVGSGAGHTDASCQAQRQSPPVDLLIEIEKTGQGTVTGTGINCGSDCSEAYPSGTVVVLTADAADGRIFLGWSGCDPSPAPVVNSGGGTCTVTAGPGEKIVRARFAIDPNFKEF